MSKQPTSFRLSAEARGLIQRLKEKHGTSEADVIEMAIRRMARVDLSERGWPPMAILDAAASLLGKTAVE